MGDKLAKPMQMAATEVKKQAPMAAGTKGSGSGGPMGDGGGKGKNPLDPLGILPPLPGMGKK